MKEENLSGENGNENAAIMCVKILRLRKERRFLLQ